jgi:capsular exopolysaccharide synthesis family protein
MMGGDADLGGGAAAVEAVAADEPKIIDFRKYLFLGMKWWWIIALGFFTGIVLSLAMIVKQEPQFRATAKIQLTRPTGIPANLQMREYEAILGDYTRTEMNIIQGRKVKDLASEKMKAAGYENGAAGLSLGVGRVWETSILTIDVTGAEPKACADYANAVADAYIEYRNSSRSGRTQDTVTTLSQQATALSGQITEMEDKLVAYRRDNGLVALEELGNPPAETLARLTRQAMDYRIERMLLEAQQPLLEQASDEVVLAALEYGGLQPAVMGRGVLAGAAEVAAGLGAADAGEGVGGQKVSAEALINQGVVEPPRWGDLKRENAMLRAKLTTYRKRYKDKHPLIVETQRKLQENSDALQVELQFALDQYYSQLEALSIKEKSASEVEKSLEDQAEAIDRKRNEYASLQRNLKRLNGLYDLIFNRLQEVDIAAASALDSVVIQERADVPSSPINPRNLQTLFIAALLGLAAGIALVLLIEFLDDTLKYPEEIAKALKVPFLGMVPGAHWKAETVADYWLPNVDPSSGFSEAYRNIRSAILLRPGSDSLKTLLITSSVPREGKTTTAANLATSFAQSGRKVLLVDADLHRGKLHKIFGLRGDWGLGDVLEGRTGWTGAVQKTSVEGLDFVATGVFPENPAEAAMRPALRQFLEDAKGVYDLVIVDAPPALAVSETAVMASLSDAYLVVVLSGRTSRKLVRITMHQLNSRGGNLLGVLLNNLDMSRAGNYNAYNYYYSYYGYEYRYEDEPQDAAGQAAEQDHPDPPENPEVPESPESPETPEVVESLGDMESTEELERLDGAVGADGEEEGPREG